MNFSSMGVINITPDSFSDTVHYFNNHELSNKIDHLINTFDILDFGAQSTAPKNASIGFGEEWLRFENNFFPIIDKLKNNLRGTISIDTYRPQIIKDLLIRLDPIKEIIWNDVSGVLDFETMEILKANPTLSYVLCHNRVKNKIDSNEHIKFIKNNANHITEEVLDFFQTNLEFLKKNNIKNKIILDPGFGFSKSMDENFELLLNLNRLINVLDKNAWLIGLSKKSLFKKFESSENNIFERECQHFFWLTKIMMENMNSKIIFRVHDDKIFFLAKKYADAIGPSVRRS